MSFTPSADAGGSTDAALRPVDAGTPSSCPYAELRQEAEAHGWLEFGLCLGNDAIESCWVTSRTETRSCPDELGREPVPGDPTRCTVREGEGFWLETADEACGGPGETTQWLRMSPVPGESFFEITCLVPTGDCR